MRRAIELKIKKLFERRFARFFAVGLWNNLLDLLILSLLLAIFNILPGQVWPLVAANCVSTSASIVSSFLLNRHFVFRDGKNPLKGKRILIFILVSLFGAYVINNTVLNLAVNWDWLNSGSYRLIELLGLDERLSSDFMRILSGKVLAALASMFWSFWAYGRFVFSRY